MTKVNVGVKDIASACEFIIALNTDDEWLYADGPFSVDSPTWQAVPGLPTGAANKRFIGRLPLISEGQWVSAALFNSATEDGNAFAVFRNPVSQNIEVKSWSNRYPVGVSLDPIEGTPNSMPKANVLSNWGDYVLLGDIQWKADSSEPYSSTNSIRYPHGIWFSRPGASDVWHPDEVFFVGQKLESNAILGMFPVEPGLVVVSQSSISLLRGRPGPRVEDFVYEELRTGVSPEFSSEVTFWPHIGLVVWMDRQGHVWATNGNDVSRIDRQIDPVKNGQGALLAVDQYLLVSYGDRVRVVNSFESAVSWTSLVSPSGWRAAASCEGLVVAVGSDQTPGDADALQVFDLRSEDRGVFNKDRVRSLIRTRALPGASDRTAFWHRFGIRASGSGVLRRAVSYPSARFPQRGLETRLRGRLKDRKDWAFNGHGPSQEAVFEFEFEGDVVPEHVTVNAHRGRSDR